MRTRVAADEADEQLFQALAAAPALPQFCDRSLRHHPAVRDHPDVRRQALDDLEDV